MLLPLEALRETEVREGTRAVLGGVRADAGVLGRGSRGYGEPAAEETATRFVETCAGQLHPSSWRIFAGPAAEASDFV